MYCSLVRLLLCPLVRWTRWEGTMAISGDDTLRYTPPYVGSNDKMGSCFPVSFTHASPNSRSSLRHRRLVTQPQ